MKKDLFKSKKIIFIIYFFGFLIGIFSFWKIFFSEKKKEKIGEIYFGLESNSNFLGRKDAKIKIIEFVDFNENRSAKVQKQLEEILNLYGKNISLEIKFLENGSGNISVSNATLCAGEEGKFFSYLEKVYVNQLATGELILSEKSLKNIAKSIDLDEKKFDSCVKNLNFKKKISEMNSDALKKGISSAPIFFVNGRSTKWTEILEIVEKQNFFIEKNLHFKFDFPFQNKIGNENAENKIVLFVDFSENESREIFKKSFDIANKNLANTSFELKFATNSKNPNSFDLAMASYCSMDSGKFWEYIQKISEVNNSSKFSRRDLTNYAKELGINEEKFNYCLYFGVTQEIVLQNFSESFDYDFLSYPILTLNGVPVDIQNLESKMK